MKVLIVNTSDSVGGAARAAYRLHKALIVFGIDSKMIVQSKQSNDSSVFGSQTKFGKGISVIRPTIDQIPVKLYKNKSKSLFSPAMTPFSNIVQQINDLNPDIVHLHWVCGGMMKIEDISRIKAPIVWSLHDMWAFTGGCHYDEECGRYQGNCGYCKVLNSNKEHDLSSCIIKRKNKSFKNNDFIIVGLSQWLASAAKESYLFKDNKVVNLPNPIDTDLFKPFNKKQARQLWNLPENKKLILFGAVGATGDPRKGYRELMNALSKLNIEDIELVVFGSSEPKGMPDLKFESHYIDRLYDDISLITLYNACDVMVVPSIQENLSNSIMESLSCGVPVVSFDIGGNSDMVEHYKNGYLAKPFNSNDLANGIDWVINNIHYNDIALNARGKIVREYDINKVVKNYIELYKTVL